MTTTFSMFRNEDALALEAGETLFRAGDPADVMYVVQSGCLEIRIGDNVVDSVGEGGVVGELALIDGLPRSADVVAVEPTRIVAIDERRFMYMVGETPYFALTVMRALAERMRRANELTTSSRSTEEV
jgi:CRP/FNR family transcriptional regulator, cyclic AMP receptor protein